MEDELKGNQEIINNHLEKVLIVFGTRLEAIKMSLVRECLKDQVNFGTRVAVTAQNCELQYKVVNLLDKVLL